MALSKADITTDLQANFPEIFKDPNQQPYLDDYAAIGSFLSGRSAIEPVLHQLEQRLTTRMFNKLGYGTDLGKELQSARIGYYRKEAQAQFNDWKSRLQARNAGNPVQRDKAYSKLVTDELTAIETHFGFALFQDENGHPKAEMIMPLKADQFRAQLKAGRPFKDPTIGPDHGEYTHRLQWALLAIGGVVKSPLKVYQNILVPWTVTPNFGLWDALVDRQPPGAPGLPNPFPFYKRNDHDFRTPEALLTWLCKPAQQDAYPLLAGFLKARKDKRKYVTDNDSIGNPLFVNYLARKLFGAPYDRLDGKQQQAVDDFAQGGQQIGVLKPKTNQPGYEKA